MSDRVEWDDAVSHRVLMGQAVMDRRGFLRWCGCAAAVGALGAAPARAAGDPQVERWSRSICDLCGLGEPVFLGVREGRLVGVKGIPASTIGFGRLCPRARALWAAAAPEHRALRPMVRRDPSTKGTAAGLEAVSWEEALEFAGEGLARVRARLGPAGVAFLASDGETNESYHILAKVARGVFGTDHVDSTARLDALHAYDACRDVFGVPGNVASLEDVDAARLVVLVGGDLAESHPSLFYRLLDARRGGRSRVILIDPRKTLAAGVADVHIRPAPGHELAVLNAAAARLVAAPRAVEAAAPPPADPFLDRGANTEVWRAWLAGRRGVAAPGCRPPLGAARPSAARSLRAGAELEAAGVEAAAVEALAGAWREARAVLTVVGPTVLSQFAGRAVATQVAQLHRATGQWGRPGAGCLFLPRGANASGVFALGIAPGRLPAGRRLEDPGARAALVRAWGVAPEALPSSSGLCALDWPAAIGAGRIGALVTIGANPAAELPAAARWREALASSFVVAAVTHTPAESEAFSDVVLPLALAVGETAGTMIALDRRCQLLERAVTPPGEARTTPDILIALARTRLDAAEHERLFGRYAAGAHVAWDEWRALSAGTPLDCTGITIGRLREELGVKWPCPSEREGGPERFGPSVAGAAGAPRATKEGGAIQPPFVLEPRAFVPTPLPACAPGTTAERPFLLVGGPIREHFRSRTRTGVTPDLHYEAPVARIEMHPADGSPLGLADGSWVTLASAEGELTARIWLTDRSPRGVLFIPEHFGFRSDLQGGSDALDEPEGLFSLLASGAVVAGSDLPAGLLAPVSVRPAHRREMRRRGLRD